MRRSDFIDNIPLLHVLFCGKCGKRSDMDCHCALFSDELVPYGVFQTEEVVFYDSEMRAFPTRTQAAESTAWTAQHIRE